MAIRLTRPVPPSFGGEALRRGQLKLVIIFSICLAILAISRYNKHLSSGRGAVRLARLHGVQEVEGSNPFAPT